MKILGTGLNGLVGSRIVELLNNSCEFENLSLNTGVDITNPNILFKKFKNSNATIVLHLAGKTDVDSCEKDKEFDARFFKNESPVGEKTAWSVNVTGTKNIVDACKKTNKRLIYISTDFVFDGKNCPENGYSEKDIPNPINWYGKTKYEGEALVKNSGLEFLIMRIAYPYRSNFERKDFVRSLIDGFRNNKLLTMIEDHIITPTFIDDIAYAFDFLVKNNQTGIFHVTGSQFLSPLDCAFQIAETFNFNKSLIAKTTREEYFKNRALRPFCLSLKNDKISKLGIKMRGFKEGLIELKRQMI
ncbi:MAG: SDR family oxidoreductase [Candidatus Levybacteria bacterium]|nr:SDR family oxidoreductase [Candidatus Levybacteria bacterium]